MPKGVYRRRVRNIERCHPLLRELFREIEARRMNLSDAMQGTGVSVRTTEGWRRQTNPHLLNIEAVANKLGFDVCLRRRA